MIANREENLKKIVNASGFVFQLAIMDNVEKTKDKHKWNILAYEHPWGDSSNGDEGYIDIILEKEALRLVIECKRTKEGSWIFLNPVDKNNEVSKVKFSWARLKKSRDSLILGKGNDSGEAAYDIISGWSDFNMKPKSHESAFCTVRGSGDNDKPMLERICGKLLKAMDCFILEEMGINDKNKSREDRYLYIPIIITNSQLELCVFDPRIVSLSDGMLTDGNFKNIQFIRFRKSLTTHLTSQAVVSNIVDANRDKERTILIISSDYFMQLLEEIQLFQLSPNPALWPN